MPQAIRFNARKRRVRDFTRLFHPVGEAKRENRDWAPGSLEVCAEAARLLNHLVRGVQIGPPASVGELRKGFNKKMFPVQPADQNHLGKAELILRAKSHGWRGA